MDILDAPLTSPISKPIWKTVFQHGTMGGLGLLMAAQTIFHSGINTTSFQGILVSLSALIVLSTVTAFRAIKKQRDGLDGGYISWGKAIAVGSLSIYLAFLLLDSWNYLYINYFDTSYLPKIKQQMIEAWSDKVAQETLAEMTANLDGMRNFSYIVKNSLMFESPLGILLGIGIAFFMSKKFRP